MSGRKRASQSTPDFQKKKIKVGKGKRPADNATNASFTTGRISVPSQLQAPNKDEIVSNRKLTVKVNCVPNACVVVKNSSLSLCIYCFSSIP